MMDHELSEMTDEFALAVECCRLAFDPSRVATVSALAAKVDWQKMLALCDRHRITGLAWNAIKSADTAIPGEAAEAFAHAARTIAEAGLRSVGQSVALVEAFTKSDIPLVFLKGLTIGQIAYGNPFLKLSSDIDLLVAPHDLERVAAVLEQCGYVLRRPSAILHLRDWHRTHHESEWIIPGERLLLELHSRLVDNPSLIPSIGMESPKQMVSVAGQALPTLTNDELFAYLCVHGATSAWFRLKWVSDLAGAIRDFKPSEVERLYRRAVALGAGRAPAQALLLAERLFGIGLSETLRAEIARDPVNRWLAAIGLRQLLADEPTRRPFGTAAIHVSQLLLGKGMGFKIRELGGQVGAALANRRFSRSTGAG